MERNLPVRMTVFSELLSLGLLVLVIIGIVNAYQGKAKPLPLIGGFLLPKN